MCEVEDQIISVERILQYTSIPSEPPLYIDENRPDHTWPSKGEIEIHDLQVNLALLLSIESLVCCGKRDG